MNKTLPPRPNLHQYKIQAKELLKSFDNKDSEAFLRLQKSHPSFANHNGDMHESGIKLSDAQWVIAREHGFESWPKFKNHIETINGVQDKRHHPLEKNIDWYLDRAKGLLSVYKTGQERAIILIRESHPGYKNATDDEILNADFTLEDAKLVYAREHGFGTWDELTKHIASLAEGKIAEPFLDALEAIKKGDTKAFITILNANQGLVNARGTNGNTLLNLAVSSNQTEAVKYLIEAGADVNIANNKGWTSLHAAAYAGGVDKGEPNVLIPALVDAGASIYLEAHGDGGTPLVQALFWGHSKTADILAEYGVTPNNLRVAAGLGDLDMIKSFFDNDDTLKPEAGSDRQFHRPHSGFPEWIPSNDSQEILDEAFVWACKNNRINVLAYLLDMGADINADPYRGTGLFWACFQGKIEAVEWLITNGADINKQGTFGGREHGAGVTALHLAAQAGHLDIVKLLMNAGSGLNIADNLFNSTPVGWADFTKQEEIRDYMLADESKLGIRVAAEFGKLKRIEELVKKNPNLINGDDATGMPLRAAVFNGHYDTVKYLLKKGADPNLTSLKSKTALSFAVMQKHDEIAELLRQYGGEE